MDKYRIVVITVSDDGKSVTCTYNSYADCMADALAKAGRYSIYQMSEEGCDYIKHISITLIGDKEGEDD